MDFRSGSANQLFHRIVAGCALLMAATTITLTPIHPPDASASVGPIATPTITAGSDHTCALSDQGRVWCWGYNAYGQLGNGTNTDSNVPVAVTGLTDAVALSGGVLHTCALRVTGTVVCWGRNDFGQLGNGNTNHSNVPTEVVNLSGATAIGSGGNHVCAIVTGGAVNCWGYNAYGQLGNGSTTNSIVPVTVSSLTGATVVGGGLRHECAIVAGGAVKCWGHNAYGQLGNGNTNHSNVPVDALGLTGMSGLGLSDQFFSCAMSGGGTVSCWGDNGGGQLGNGTFVDSTVPVTVSNLQTASAIESGSFHACAVLADGTMQCWGDGSQGQLGNGTDGVGVASNVPVVVPNITGAIEVGAGYFHTCAILRSGGIRCWGDNARGELGNGTSTDSAVPVEVQGIVLVTPIVVPIWRVELDPNDGSCVDSTARTEPWTSVFVGYRYLPAASDCTRPGYIFTGWADVVTPTTVRSLPLLVDPSDNERRYFVTENLDLIAVWNVNETSINDLVVFANFLCGPCTSAWLIHEPVDADVSITVDETKATCNQTGTVFGLSVCELTNLASGMRTVTVTPSGGKPASVTFTLRS